MSESVTHNSYVQEQTLSQDSQVEASFAPPGQDLKCNSSQPRIFPVPLRKLRSIKTILLLVAPQRLSLLSSPMEVLLNQLNF